MCYMYNFYDESLNLVEKFESELTNEEIKRRLLLVNISSLLCNV